MTEFIGFPRPDGSVGIRNHVLLLGLDQASVNVCHKVAGLVKESLLVLSRTGDRGFLSDAARHPNAAGSVVVGENLTEQDRDGLISDLEGWGKPFGVIEAGSMGFMEALSGRAFHDVTVFGVEPGAVAWGAPLSPAVAEAVERLADAVLGYLETRLSGGPQARLAVAGEHKP